MWVFGGLEEEDIKVPSWADTQISINDNDVEKLLRDYAIITWWGGGGGLEN